MFEFYIYETVTLAIKVSDPDVLDACDKIVISLAQGKKQFDYINRHSVEREEGIINLHLSQEETAEFKPGKVKLQVNFYYTDTERDTSSETTIMALNNLYRKVIE